MKIYHKHKLSGEIIDRIFYGTRQKWHIFRKYEGIAISVDVLKQIEGEVDWIVWNVIGVGCYKCHITQYLLSNLTINHNDDLQLCVPFSEMLE